MSERTDYRAVRSSLRLRRVDPDAVFDQDGRRA
jgi:hypothetical protein